MEVFSSWVENNWSNVITAAGIVGSLLFSAVTVRADCKAKQVSNLLAIEERHRVLWSEAQQRPDLKRIFSPDANVSMKPLTAEEVLFLKRVILHFETGWRLEKTLGRGEMRLLGRDIAEVLYLPLPRLVWNDTVKFHNPEFVRFVKQAIERHGRL